MAHLKADNERGIEYEAFSGRHCHFFRAYRMDPPHNTTIQLAGDLQVSLSQTRRIAERLLALCEEENP